MLRFVMAEILPAAVFLVPMYLLLWKKVFHAREKTILYFLFSCYLCAVYAFVGLPNVTYIRFEVAGNLIPFRDMLSSLRSSVQNILLFVPLGIFLPLLWERYRVLKNTALFGLFASCVIELLQVFTYRATDINDLLTNTLGTVLGWLFSAVLLKRICRTGAPERDLVVVLATAFAGMFFLQPFLVAMLS